MQQDDELLDSDVPPSQDSDSTSDLSLEDAVSRAYDETSGDAPSATPSADEPVEDDIPMPHSWAKDHADHWRQTPRPLKEIIQQREAERDKFHSERSGEYGRLKQVVNRFSQVFEPAREMYGDADPVDVVKNLIAADRYLRSNPREALAFLAKSYGIGDFGGQQQTQADEWVDPHVIALQKELQQTRLQMQSIAQGVTQQQRYRQEQEQLQVIRSLDKWASANDKGVALRPHIDDVLSTMPHFVDVARTQNPAATNEELLNAAYEMACWSSPIVRNKLVAIEAKRSAQQKQQVAQRAAQAGVSITGAPGAGATEAPKNYRTVQEAAEAAYAATTA